MIYPAPYGFYDRKEKNWIPLDALTKTIDSLELKLYNPNQLVGLLNEIYSKNRDFSVKSKSNAKTLKNEFRNNWLINPMNSLKIDDNDTNQWKSRDIGPQDTVFVTKPSSVYFKSYFDFQSWKMENSLEIPIYLIQKYEKEKITEKITVIIGEDEETILLIKEGYYDSNKGISLPSKDIFL